MEQVVDIAAILKDPKFVSILSVKIAAEKIARKMRSSPEKGLKWRRDWLDTMLDQDIFYAETFIEEIKLIDKKQSKLNKESRNVIQHFCGIALQEFLTTNKK